jgi:transcriptional regulator with XRE-family HTH domain
MVGRKRPGDGLTLDHISVHIGRQIRRRRLMLNMTQIELAEPLGLSFQSIQKYETGENRISGPTLARMAAILKVPFQYFVEGLSGDIADSGALSEQEWLALNAVKPLSELPGKVRDEFITLFKVLLQTMKSR